MGDQSLAHQDSALNNQNKPEIWPKPTLEMLTHPPLASISKHFHIRLWSIEAIHLFFGQDCGLSFMAISESRTFRVVYGLWNGHILGLVSMTGNSQSTIPQKWLQRDWKWLGDFSFTSFPLLVIVFSPFSGSSSLFFFYKLTKKKKPTWNLCSFLFLVRWRTWDPSLNSNAGVGQRCYNCSSSTICPDLQPENTIRWLQFQSTGELTVGWVTYMGRL